MINRYGVDTSYFRKNLKLLQRDIDNYRPDELARALARLSITADHNVLKEGEFNLNKDNEVTNNG